MSQLLSHQEPWFSCYHPRPEAKWRLIGFPHGGGGPRAFREWGSLLPAEIEVVSLSLPGRGSRLQEPLITSMEELVPQLVEGLKDYFDKPFVLFGHSVGALVAFEVTRQLLQAGYPLPLQLFVSAMPAPRLRGGEWAKGQGGEKGAEPLRYQYSDANLLRLITELGMVPEQALNNAELLSLILPPLKGDLELSERYQSSQQYIKGPDVRVPITALGGRYDQLASEADLRAWEAYTTGPFSLQLFNGRHFYTESHQDKVLAFIAESMKSTIATLPKSIMRGQPFDYPEKCLHELFREQAAKTPEAQAIVGVESSLTFRELDEQSDLLARYLINQGVRVDMLTGIYMESSVAYVVAYIAALKAGGAYMPIDVAYPEALLEQVLVTASPVVVLTNERYYDLMPPAWQECAFKMDGEWAVQLASESLHVPEVAQPTLPLSGHALDNLAYCVMSSGTTGTPKGIICPHRGAVNSYYWRYVYYPYQKDEREACNVFFVWEVIRPILQGIPAYVIPDEVIYDSPRLVEYLHKHRITRILFTPSLLEQVLNTPHLDLQNKLRHLRIVYLNGEVVTTALRNRFSELFPHVTLLNDYSISECHDVCTYDLAELNPIYSPKYASVGTPMDNVSLYLLDENQQPVPIGFKGEIYVGGDSIGSGYLKQPEKTAQRFPRDPFVNDGSLMFRTGDAGRILPNGHLEIQGRIAFMIKLRGYSIVPSAVETTIMEHPAVNAAVVITQDNAETGQPEHLVAYVVGNGQQDEMLHNDLRDYLKQKLPHYAIPSYIIPLEQLPIAASGKLDRRKLPQPQEAITRLKHTRQNMKRAHKSPTEKALTDVWQSLLNIGSVETTDNFFDLGGHSLLTIQLLAQIQEKFQVALPLRQLLENPTIAALAHKLEHARSLCESTILEGMSVSELQAEVTLVPSIRPPAHSVAPSEPQAIFLTGVTGFLGPFLLNELLQQTEAKIYCLVRHCKTVAEGRQRVQNNLERYLLADLLAMVGLRERIIPVIGDLSQPLLGLEAPQFEWLGSEIDLIYHNGADVNILYPYTVMRAPNVHGTQEILRLATQSKLKPVHYISTLGIFEATGIRRTLGKLRRRKKLEPSAEGWEAITEGQNLDECEVVYGGYAQSKWVAEKIVQLAKERGIPVTIYRPGMITAHSQTGAANSDDMLSRLLKHFIQHGKAPDFDIMIDMTPVDYVSQAIVYLSNLSKQEQSLGQIFHLLNPRPLHLSQLIKEMNDLGYPIVQIDGAQWLSELKASAESAQESPLGALLPLLAEKIAGTELSYLEFSSLTMRFDSQNTHNRLSNSTIVCPPVDARWLKRYLGMVIK